ncbi:MAG: 4-hydroxy-tetrahydrodipicolinate synthase [Candidatus Eisenbacteria bacterium]
MRFAGLSVAMVTPFRGGEVDWDGVDRMLDHLLTGGVDGIVPAGTTGEGATLSQDEKSRLFRRCVEKAKGKAFVLAGTGSNDTRATIETTKMAEECGVDGALVVTPYYNKPSQAGLIAHFRAVADASTLPIVLYNVPGRTSVKMDVPTMKVLAEHPRIVAVKEACGSLDMVTELIRDTRLTVLSGDDSLTLPMLAVGTTGVISVLGNVVPAALQAMLTAYREGKDAEARRLHLALFELSRTLFLETNPTPVKRALATLGLIEEEFRLPLVPVQTKTAEAVDRELAALPDELAPTVAGQESGGR